MVATQREVVQPGHPGCEAVGVEAVEMARSTAREEDLQIIGWYKG